MIEDDDILDKLFRSKLENFEEDPSERVWNHIQQSLSDRRKKRLFIGIRWTAAAALVVLSFWVGTHWQSGNKKPKEIIDDSSLTQSLPDYSLSDSVETKIKPLTVAKRKQPVLVSEHIGNKNEIANNLVPVYQISDSVSSKKLKIDSNRIENKNLNYLQSLSLEQSDYQLLVSKLAVSSSPDGLTDEDRLIIARNIAMQQQRKQTFLAGGNWVVGANVLPVYTQNNYSYSESYAKTVSGDQNAGHFSAGAGFMLSYETKHRLAFTTGLNYVRIGPGNNNDSNSLADVILSQNPTAVNVEGSNSTNAENLTVNAVAGVIALNSKIFSTQDIYNDLAVTGTSNSEIAVSDDNIQQLFDYLEIPLGVNYELLTWPIKFRVSAAMNSGILVGNRAYYSNGESRVNVGKTEDMRSLSFSSQLGVLVSYNILPEWSIHIGPNVRYYFQSLNRSDDIDFKPYLFSVSTGVSYKF